MIDFCIFFSFNLKIQEPRYFSFFRLTAVVLKKMDVFQNFEFWGQFLFF